jgi:glycosyltransferase involved in cell wall biosynthesis
MNNPLISFILPVYKALPWLERSLSSILDSEKKAPLPIEILICDDASPDDTGKLVDTLAETDSRIVPLHNRQNGSVCYSRNRCLDLAKGEWICFTDQDDVLDENAFEVFRKTLDDDSEIIYYGFQDFYDGSPISMGDGNPGPARIFTGEEIRKLQWDCLCRYRDSEPLISWRLLPVPWGKLYRRSFLNEYHIRFREGLHREEDIGFNLTALAHCTHVKECPYPLYHYRRSLDTQSHTYRPNIRKETDETLAWYREIIAEHFPGDERMDELYRFRELWGTLYNIALGCGHADNPKPYRERKRDFDDLFASPTLDAAKALDPAMIRRLDPLHRTLATLARRRDFRAIWMLGKLEPLTYKLKIR